jgi:hypothetical protein
VDIFHNHWNCKIRGLCAENLTAHILSLNNVTRGNLLSKFMPQIQYWLEDEEDCWVLEHVFRLFSTLHDREVDTRRLFPAKTSRILRGMPQWFTLTREDFLTNIEKRKRELARPSLLARITKRALNLNSWAEGDNAG